MLFKDEREVHIGQRLTVHFQHKGKLVSWTGSWSEWTIGDQRPREKNTVRGRERNLRRSPKGTQWDLRLKSNGKVWFFTTNIDTTLMFIPSSKTEGGSLYFFRVS